MFCVTLARAWVINEIKREEIFPESLFTLFLPSTCFLSCNSRTRVCQFSTPPKQVNENQQHFLSDSLEWSVRNPNIQHTSTTSTTYLFWSSSTTTPPKKVGHSVFLLLKQNKTKQNKAKQNKTKQNKTKQIPITQNESDFAVLCLCCRVRNKQKDISEKKIKNRIKFFQFYLIP